MALGGGLTIGRSGLLTHRTAIEVAGSNLANIATPGYHRQRVELANARPQEIRNGVFVGRGVELSGITRQVNEALEARLRGSISDSAQSDASFQLLTQVEAIQNEFTDIDLSSRLGEFFDAWSLLANNPQDLSQRTLAIQESQTLSDYLQDVRGQYTDLRQQTKETILGVARSIDDLLVRIEDVNQEILLQERGAFNASGLRDQRDLALGELAQYLDISTIERESGVVDVFVGSTPILLNGRSRGVQIDEGAVDGVPTLQLEVTADGSPLTPRSGEIGALIAFHDNDIDGLIGTLDQFAGELIYQVNRVHSQGQGLIGFDSVTSSYVVADSTVPLNDAATELPFAVNNGSFELHLTQTSTGIRTTDVIDIDLDGINPATDTTLDDLATSLSAVAGVTATVLPNGRLEVVSDNSDFQISFANDTSGVLAGLGINTVFTGENAFDIAVNDVVVNDPRAIAAALEHLDGDNRTALAIAGLRETGFDSLNGLSLTAFWNRHVEDLAVQTAQAREANQADQIVQDNLIAQQQAVSGVNTDEEAIDLLRYQRAYQASAQFISVVDELMQTLLNII